MLEVPVGDGGLEQGLGQREAGVVDDQVHPAEGEHGRVDHGLDGGLVGHVDLDADRDVAVPISAAAAWAFSSDRSAITTQAPSAASLVAMALPMPEAAPVTSAMRVASGLGFGIRWSLASSSAQYSMRNFSASSMGAYVESPSAPRITLMALT